MRLPQLVTFFLVLHTTSAFISPACNDRVQRYGQSSLKATPPEGSIENIYHRQPLKSPVETFTTLSECLDAMDQAHALKIKESTSSLPEKQPELTIVLFFAHYCKLCHQANIPYKKMAYQNPNIRFTRLETSIMTPAQFRSIGITRVPFVQIYRNGVCVASFNTKWQLENKLTQAIVACQSRTLIEWENFMRQFEEEIHNNKISRARMRAESLFHADEEVLSKGVQTLASEVQFLGAIKQSNQTTTVIMFHSHFEKACLRAQRQFRQIAEKSQAIETENAFKFARVESSVINDSFLMDLGVQQFPFIQIYKDEKCIASFSIPQTYLFNRLVNNSLDQINKRHPNEWKKFFADFQHEILQNNRIVEKIRQANQIKP